MQLFKLPPPPTDLVAEPEPQALAQRETLLDVASEMKAVQTEAENSHVALVGSGIRKLVNDVETARKELTAPYLAAQRAIKRVADDFCAPLLEQMDRLGRLSAVYRIEQERRAADERQKRADEIAKLQEQERQAAEAARKAAEQGDLMATLQADIKATALAAATTAAVAAPPPEATKTTGQAFQGKVLGWECVDPIALWNARPDLCEPPKPKASAIRSTCVPERPVPGLKLWWESKVSFKSR